MPNKKLQLLSTLLLLYFPINSQTDSLYNVAKKQTGKEKIATLSEICFQLSTVNIQKSIAIGREAFLLATQSKDSLLMASVANDLSLPYLYRGGFDSCIYFAQFAHDVRWRNKQIVPAINSKSKVALAYQEKGDLKNALQINMEVEQAYRDQKQFLLAAKIQNNIGNIFDHNNQIEESLQWFLKSADFTKKEKEWSGYITAMGNVGIAYRKLNKTKLAEKTLLDLIPLTKEKGRPEQLSQIYQSLGVVYRDMNNTKTALEYYLKSRAIYAEIGSDLGMTSIDANIGNCYRDLGDISNATKYLESSYALAKKLKSWQYLKTPLEGLVDLEIKKNNPGKANAYLLELMQVKDSIYSEDTKKILGDLQIKYATAEKENKLLLQESLINKQAESLRMRNYWILSALLLAALLGIFVVWRIQSHKRKKVALELENKMKLQNERVRISRDLHDNMGAEITLLSSLIDSKTFKSDNPNDKKELQEMGNISRNAMSMLRETIWTINDEAVALERMGLKIKEYAEKLTQGKTISIEYNSNFNGSFALPPHQSLHVYRIFQEAIQNVVKHANASTIKMDVENSDANHFSIQITDNGNGIGTNAGNGNGLNNMQNRAKEAGLQLQMENLNPGYTVKVFV